MIAGLVPIDASQPLCVAASCFWRRASYRGAGDHAGCISWRSLTRTCSSSHDHRMPVPLFAHKPEQCPYGHSLTPGMPQKISWMPCICEPAREAERQSRGMGHLMLWCGTCSAEDHRDTRFYEPPHQVGYSGPVSGWMTRPDALARRRRRPGRRRQPRADRRPGR